MLQDFVQDLRPLFLPGAHTELRVQENRARRAVLIGGDLTGNARSETSGISARVEKNGLYGFSSVADVSPEAAGTVLTAAGDNARFMDAHCGRGERRLPPLPQHRIDRTDADRDSDPEQRLYIDFARAVDDYIAKKYKSLSTRRIVTTADSMEKVLATSDGASGSTRIARSYLFLMFDAAAKDGTIYEMFTAFGGNGDFDRNFRDPASLYAEIDDLYERLMEKCEGVHANAGPCTCVLSGELSGMLAHEAVGHTVEADLVLGGSVAAHALGHTVASPLVSMTDFAHTALGAPAPLPVYLDDEGTPARDVELIRDGVLVGYMNNRDSAQHFGMEPAGNARAYDFSDEPLIRMRNTAVLPGTSKLDDMISGIDDGYYLVRSNNGQADTTGEFMFGVTEGYEIKHGKIGRALFDTTISGVAFEMLKTVDMVSDEMIWTSAGMCGKKQPMPVGMGGPALRCRVMIGGR